jgi:hypothetical protein
LGGGVVEWCGGGEEGAGFERFKEGASDHHESSGHVNGQEKSPSPYPLPDYRERSKREKDSV